MNCPLAESKGRTSRPSFFASSEFLEPPWSERRQRESRSQNFDRKGLASMRSRRHGCRSRTFSGLGSRCARFGHQWTVARTKSSYVPFVFGAWARAGSVSRCSMFRIPGFSVTTQRSRRTPKSKLSRSFVTTSSPRDVLLSTPYRGHLTCAIRGGVLVASNNRCS